MKALLFNLFCVVPLFMFSQSEVGVRVPTIQLEGTTWKSNIHCFTSEDVASYTLFPKNDSVYFDWGNFISFTKTGFTTSYSAPCGVDCFTNVTGTYEFIGGNKIRVFVKSISRNGFCQEESETPDKSFGVYRIERVKEGLRITKT
ncbi:MAG: hypothetical protein HUJ25_02235 [Crocinitomicaceae bacterium]|nr:hypothetical protein [Crocinitomicaceae bacterium]